MYINKFYLILSSLIFGEQGNMLIYFQGTLANILKEQENKTSFWKHGLGNFENYFQGTREHGQLYLGKNWNPLRGPL